jgi:hypothetical protein
LAVFGFLSNTGLASIVRWLRLAAKRDWPWPSLAASLPLLSFTGLAAAAQNDHTGSVTGVIDAVAFEADAYYVHGGQR